MWIADIAQPFMSIILCIMSHSACMKSRQDVMFSMSLTSWHILASKAMYHKKHNHHASMSLIGQSGGMYIHIYVHIKGKIWNYIS